MPVLSDERPLTPEEYSELKKAIAALKASFGWGRVKVEANRRLEPQVVGRPKVWHEIRLFTLWLIVQTWALRNNCKIDTACHHLEKYGGLLRDTETGSEALVSGSERIRRLYYEANTELDAYEVKYKNIIKLDREDFYSLKERLFNYAEILSMYEIFFASGLSKASGSNLTLGTLGLPRR